MNDANATPDTDEFVGMSDRMIAALKAEGLILTKSVEEDGIIYEGLFYTGIDYEKIVHIDLRGKRPKTERKADQIAIIELRDAYDNYSVAEEMRMYLNAEKNRLKGVPEPDRLLADLQEEEKRLERFADVANAVYWNIPIPQEPEEPSQQYSCRHSFFVVRSARADNLFWKTLEGYHNGAVDDCWSDALTADRFDTEEEAESFIIAETETGDKESGTVVRVETETTIKLYETKQNERSQNP